MIPFCTRQPLLPNMCLTKKYYTRLQKLTMISQHGLGEPSLSTTGQSKPTPFLSRVSCLPPISTTNKKHTSIVWQGFPQSLVGPGMFKTRPQLTDTFFFSRVFCASLDQSPTPPPQKKNPFQILAEVSTGLGPAMVGVSDIQGDAVNFRGREGGGQIPKKRKLEGKSETQLYGSSWETK